MEFNKMYDQFINYSYEDRKNLLFRSINEIVSFLEGNQRFEKDKIGEFIYYLIGVFTSIDGGLTKEQYDLFKDVTNIPHAYEDLKKYLDDIIDESDRDSLIKILDSYNEDDKSECLIVALALLTLKKSLTEDEKAFFESAFAEADKTEREINFNKSLLKIQDDLMAKSIEDRKIISINSALTIIEDLKKQDIEEDDVYLLLLKVVFMFLKIDSAIDHKLEYSVINKLIDITYDEFVENINKEIDQEEANLCFEFINKTNTKTSFIILGMALSSLDSIICMDTFDLALKIYNY